DVSPVAIAGFLVGLKVKGETIDEIAGAALAMRDAATRVKHSHAHTVDTCGTGGDGQHTFNISTAAGFIVAGAGYAVAKHGNKCVSSQCGSADVLQELGVNINFPVERLGSCLDTIGIAFLFAPKLHAAMKHAMPVRKELKVRTIFNILGPLANPAQVTAQVIGVYDPSLVKTIGSVLVRLGVKHSMVVHGSGLDEITLTGLTRVGMIQNNSLTVQTINPADFGMPSANSAEIEGKDPKTNAAYIREILDGKKGKRREIAVLNAAAAILVASRDTGDNRAEDFPAAIRLARESLDTGAALKKLNDLIAFTIG
ncbi:MAG: anthranilate phosphoribosyltransferase, partial [Elusimicrobia bacterium]|nr:anthranilate phosphoribosyltransferase [Elusimicrobiota bacterium]